jgi:ubiquinone/menaquinone biosynthesis C-methylase UbiE
MLEWTGERFLPWIKESTIAYEHLHRYAYASTFVKDKRVLDLASGEGYGSEILAASAASVAGIDIDENAVRHAAEKYGRTNLQFISGSITAIPIRDDRSFDVIVCFEAIEHIEDQEKLLGEVKRLLKPEGLFIVSTPNKVIYHDESGEENPFHVKELYFEEFQRLLAGHFQNIRFLGQRIHPGSNIWPIEQGRDNGFQQFVVDRRESGFEFIDGDKRVPMYFIAIASDSAAALTQPASILIDHSDGLIKEKEREISDTKASAAEAIEWKEQQVREREETIASLEDAVKWREGGIRDLEAAIRNLEAASARMRQDFQSAIQQREEALAWTRNQISEFEKTVASNEQALAWRMQQVTELEGAKAFWERESASLNASLQNTQHRLSLATEQLESIYASRGWKFIAWLRQIRDKLMGRAKPRA